MAICLCLFSESLDPKTDKSAMKRQQYLERMKKRMNGTYDPEILSRMKIYGSFVDFNVEAYQRALLKYDEQLDAAVRDRVASVVSGILEGLAE